GVPTLVDDDRDPGELRLERGVVVEDGEVDPALGGGAEVLEPGLDVPLLDDVQDVGHVSPGLLELASPMRSHIVYVRQCTVRPPTHRTSSPPPWYAHAASPRGAPALPTAPAPYTPEAAGLEPIRKPADVVVMSSALDEAHSYWQQVPGEPRVLNALDAVREPV